MMYGLYIFGVFLAEKVPLRVGYAVARFAARLYFLFAAETKKKLGENLAAVLGDESDSRVITKHVMAVFSNFAKYLTDFFRFDKFTKKYISENVEIVGREHLDGALAQGKGVIALTIHVGNWEMGAAVVGMLKYPISALVLEHADRRVNDFFVRQRAIFGIRSVPVGIGVKECFKVLQRNEVLAIAGDKNYTQGGKYVKFFGQDALVPKGAAVFAVRTGAPIVFTTMIRKKDDTFKLCFEEPIKARLTGNRDDDVLDLMGRYLRKFEECIRKNPDQWYAFKRIWPL
ncbi:MAG: lysophospholipid acyltransferase family protein [Candidatus Omnitrophota bacterium]